MPPIALDRIPAARGDPLEHLVGVGVEGTIWPETRLQHFRTRRGAEVDFVLSVGRDLWAIEVKASRRVDARDLKGLDAFVARAGKVARRVVVYLGVRSQQTDGVDILPLDEFLAELPS